MVFSSVPLYLDPPNWQQQHISSLTQGNDQNQHLIHPMSVPNPPPTHMGGGGGGPGGSPQIRPNSMAERARLAKIPPPEAPLKCPRCDSTNTKFCYFNNYNLSQPRHFCKTCRRYWTRGGALRNVPVGGGCRRNKRSSSKTNSSGGGGGGTPSSTSAKPSAAGMGGGMDVGGPTGLVHGVGSGGMTSFMASLQNMAQLGIGNLGLTYGGALHAPPLGGGDHHPQLDFNNVSSFLNQHHHHQHHHHHAQTQMHFPGAFELPPAPGVAGAGGNTNMHYSSTSSFQNGNDDVVVSDHSSLQKSTASLSQFATVKMKGEQQVQGQEQGLNLAGKQLMMGINNNNNNNTSSSTSIRDNNNQVWGSGMVGNGTNMWTDLSGLNSSSTSHLM